MRAVSTEYKKCHCGANCYKFDTDSEEEQRTHPCWGQVEAVDEISSDEEYGYVHACEGHADGYIDDTSKYTPPPQSL